MGRLQVPAGRFPRCRPANPKKPGGGIYDHVRPFYAVKDLAEGGFQGEGSRWPVVPREPDSPCEQPKKDVLWMN